MHTFEVKGVRYGEKDPELETKDESRVRLHQIVAQPRAKFRYEYDMGDSWLHDITVEKILPVEPGQQYPFCIDGALACPPEDCGGIFGFYGLLETISNPKHKDYKEMREWLGGDFDQQAFDLNKVNKLLKAAK